MKNPQKPAKSIDSYLVNLIEQSVKSALQQKSLQEKEKQESNSAPKVVKDTESSKMKKGDVTVDDVIDKLNSIRSGKSFKDDAIKKSFEEYFNKLDQAEKIAMFTFLKAISQIITGEIDSKNVVDPSEKPAEIEMKKSDAPKSVTIKPTVVKSAKEEKKEKKPSEEDTSGPVPISPKKK